MGATSSAASYRLGSDVVGAGAVVAPGAVPIAGAGVAAVIAGAMKTIAETVPVSDPTGGAVAPPAAAPAAGAAGAAAAGPEPPAGATPSVVTTNARGSDSRLLRNCSCLLYTSDAADEEDSVDLGGRRIIKKKKEE